MGWCCTKNVVSKQKSSKNRQSEKERYIENNENCQFAMKKLKSVCNKSDLELQRLDQELEEEE